VHSLCMGVGAHTAL